jgi:hypothetical protein
VGVRERFCLKNLDAGDFDVATNLQSIEVMRFQPKNILVLNLRVFKFIFEESKTFLKLPSVGFRTHQQKACEKSWPLSLLSDVP